MQWVVVCRYVCRRSCEWDTPPVTGNFSWYPSSHNAPVALLHTHSSKIPATIRSNDALVGTKKLFDGILGHSCIDSGTKERLQNNMSNKTSKYFNFNRLGADFFLSPLNIWCNWDIIDANKSRVNVPNRLFCTSKPKQVLHVSATNKIL